MGIILRSEVNVISRGLSFGGKPAMMDLHDDGRFVLVRFDPRTGTFGDKVIDTSVANLSVKGAGTYLYITVDGRRNRVDFAGASPVGVGTLGLIGAAISNSYAQSAGLPNWLAEFRNRGLLRSYSNTMRNLAILLGILFGILLILFVVIALVRAAS